MSIDKVFEKCNPPNRVTMVIQPGWPRTHSLLILPYRIFFDSHHYSRHNHHDGTSHAWFRWNPNSKCPFTWKIVHATRIHQWETISNSSFRKNATDKKMSDRVFFCFFLYSPVRGFVPPLAKLAAIMERVSASTAIEQHWKYKSSVSSKTAAAGKTPLSFYWNETNTWDLISFLLLTRRYPKAKFRSAVVFSDW